jgi:hypothetical protein
LLIASLLYAKSPAHHAVFLGQLLNYLPSFRDRVLRSNKFALCDCEFIFHLAMVCLPPVFEGLADLNVGVLFSGPLIAQPSELFAQPIALGG